MRVFLLAGLAAMAGCYKPQFEGCNIKCAADGEQCPDGMTCDTATQKCKPDDSDICDPQPPLANLIAIATGGRHACALGADTQLYCWGANDFGQVDGTPSEAVLQPRAVGAGISWSAVDAGAFHTCAIGEKDGSTDVYCWGRNDDGQCGDLVTNATVGVTKVEGVVRPTQIATGLGHSCAIDVTHQLSCWGLNSLGQLGTQVALMGHTPNPQLVGGPEWAEVSVDSQTSCAIKSDDTLWCWGNNGRGQLANGTSNTIPQPIPMPVVGIAIDGTNPVLSLSVGSESSCIVLADGLHCWGDNVVGEAGVDPNGPDGGLINKPVLIDNAAGPWTAVRMGHELGCAITGDDKGDIRCWGFDDTRLGDNTDESRAGAYGPQRMLPVRFPDGTTPGVAVKLDVGGAAFGIDDGFGCALFGDASGGVARCWGANDFGQLGDGTRSIVTEATKIISTGQDPFEVVRVGSRTACAIRGGQTYCWGDNSTHKVAPLDGEPLTFDEPTLVAQGANATDVAIGNRHVCAVVDLDVPGASSTVSCWGRNDDTVLGDGSAPASATVASVPLGKAFRSISASGNMTCVFDNEMGSINRCWGTSLWLGDNMGSSGTQPGPLMTNLIKDRLSLGPDSGCLYNSSTDTTQCFGIDPREQRGDGLGDSMDPVEASDVVNSVGNAVMGGFLQVSPMDSAAHHRCGVTATDTFCWGANDSGQVGTPLGGGDVFFARALDDVPFRVRQQIITDTTDLAYRDQRIAAGGDFTCAIANADSSVHCWGDNQFRQGTTTGDNNLGKHKKIAVDGGATPSFKSIAAGTASACALDDAGDIYCWGRSKNGECGTGVADRDFAVTVLGPMP